MSYRGRHAGLVGESWDGRSEQLLHAPPRGSIYGRGIKTASSCAAGKAWYAQPSLPTQVTRLKRDTLNPALPYTMCRTTAHKTDGVCEWVVECVQYLSIWKHSCIQFGGGRQGETRRLTVTAHTLYGCPHRRLSPVTRLNQRSSKAVLRSASTCPSLAVSNSPCALLSSSASSP